MSASAADHRFMGRALQLARRGLYSAHPNPRVGCVIVAGDAVVAEGWHQRTGGPHAEAVALAAAGARARGATAYVTLEPCSHHGRTPPCADALVAAGVARVVYAVADANPKVAGAGAARLRAAGIEVTDGVLAAEARALNPGFFSRMERGRPWVRAKLAVSLDGRTALAGGESRWITGEAARRDAHELRARSAAILTGVGTVLADDPALTARRPDLGEIAGPERVVLDSALRTPPGAQLLRQPGRSRLFCSRPDAARAAALQAAGAVVETVPERAGRPDLDGVLRRLGALEINEVLVEAGPALNGALLDAGLVDEIVVYLAPHVIGADGLGMFASRPLAGMGARHEFEPAGMRRVGADLRLTYLKRRN
jgi:diaminohydroxyphosphoribosylaminopyrimidine deaminase / 5-amino-6-(5-phosphoribosylamino)uracil reductase